MPERWTGFTVFTLVRRCEATFNSLIRRERLARLTNRRRSQIKELALFDSRMRKTSQRIKRTVKPTSSERARQLAPGSEPTLNPSWSSSPIEGRWNPQAESPEGDKLFHHGQPTIVLNTFGNPGRSAV